MTSNTSRTLVAGLVLALVGAALPALPDSALAAQSDATATQAPTVPEPLKPLFEGIALNDRQVQQINQVHQKHGGAIGMPAMPPDSTKAGMGAGAVDHRAEEAKELRTVLTADQQRQFDKNLDRVKAGWTSKPSGY